MSIGVQVNKSVLDNELGNLARSLKVSFDNATTLKAFLDARTAQNLVDEFGYTLNEANVIKSAIADADQLRQVFEGGANLPSTKDFTTFMKSLWGTGTR